MEVFFVREKDGETCGFGRRARGRRDALDHSRLPGAPRRARAECRRRGRSSVVHTHGRTRSVPVHRQAPGCTDLFHEDRHGERRVLGLPSSARHDGVSPAQDMMGVDRAPE